MEITGAMVTGRRLQVAGYNGEVTGYRVRGKVTGYRVRGKVTGQDENARCREGILAGKFIVKEATRANRASVSGS